MLGAKPQPHEDLVARRDHQCPPGGPAREVDVSVSEGRVSHPRADVADRADHVGPELLGPVPLSGGGISEGRAPYELERRDQCRNRYAVDAGADERPEPLPVGADERLQVQPAGVRLRQVRGAVLGGAEPASQPADVRPPRAFSDQKRRRHLAGRRTGMLDHPRAVLDARAFGSRGWRSGCTEQLDRSEEHECRVGEVSDSRTVVAHVDDLLHGSSEARQKREDVVGLVVGLVLEVVPGGRDGVVAPGRTQELDHAHGADR